LLSNLGFSGNMLRAVEAKIAIAKRRVYKGTMMRTIGVCMFFQSLLAVVLAPKTLLAIASEALAQTIHQVEGITHCYSIQSRGVVGRQVFVEMRLILHPECVSMARTIAERVERVIRDRYGSAKVVIYIDSDRPKSD